MTKRTPPLPLLRGQSERNAAARAFLGDYVANMRDERTDMADPYADYAGYRGSRRTGPILADGSRGWVTVYRAEDQGMCDEAGPWAVVCETHATLLNEPTLREARESQACGSILFCDECRDADKGI